MSPCRVALAAVPYLSGVFLLMGSVAKFWTLLGHSELVFLGGSGPAHAIAMIAVASLELTTGWFLIFPDRKFPAITVAGVMFVCFSAYLTFNYFGLFGLRGKCGCGAGEQFFAGQAAQFRFGIIRNGVLLAGLVWYAASAIKSGGARTTPEILRLLAGLKGNAVQ